MGKASQRRDKRIIDIKNLTVADRLLTMALKLQLQMICWSMFCAVVFAGEQGWPAVLNKAWSFIEMTSGVAFGTLVVAWLVGGVSNNVVPSEDMFRRNVNGTPMAMGGGNIDLNGQSCGSSHYDS